MINNLEEKLDGKLPVTTNEFIKTIDCLYKFFNKQFCLLKQCGQHFVFVYKYNVGDRQLYESNFWFDNKVDSDKIKAFI